MISDELPLSRALADRAAELRTRPDALDDARADTATRVLLVADAQVLTGDDGALSLLTVADAVASRAQTQSPPDDEAWLLLGRHEATTYLALRVPAGHPVPRRGEAADVLVHRPATGTPDDETGQDRWTPLRQIGGDLSALDAGLATTAVALDAWHTRHPRCPRCGAATTVVQAGWVRRCVADGSEHYPRTDAAVIMAVVDESDRLLLGRAAAWAERRFSTLAGFVEPGESLEHAVRREVLEEAAVVVGDVEYRGSQPWPFPASLMVGFFAHATSTEVRPDGDELVEARWFTRDELAAAVRAGEVIPPGRASIARALVEDWFGGPLPASSDPSATWR
ncbi:NAD(+) diphosphatase [Cellulomonas rhizosphaerae]|uniref:NAD(+) diphosphatase n=1 Tax=Cellulomonas rhizosphaerae TaxID=2293719 RepID=A0A413RQA6_9CELL|nr:NAD(+) diphosphatase [Cellulomonas rhizosphaerae]RHA44172.1 NAD(+) diphosphatase [Cellulomonas rhizosphaerae]